MVLLSTKLLFGNQSHLHKKSDIPNPFWIRPDRKKSNFKKILKRIWKWSKLAIFIFFMSIGLWGCFQTMWDSTVATSNTIGSGLEFGYAFGSTGDYNYDLSSTYGYSYFTFDTFTMDYGIFYAIFVYPTAILGISLMYATRWMWGGVNALLTIFVLLLIVRTFSLLVTLRSTIQNEKMSEVQGKVAEINAKYKDLKDMESRQKKQQEIMAIYRKHKIKPFAALEQMAITLPIFMVIYRFVTITRPFKAVDLFGIWSFTASPGGEIMSNLTNGGWLYIFLVLIIVPIQFISMVFPQKWAKTRNRNATAITQKGNAQYKKTKMTQYIFAGFMCFLVVVYATGVGVYWFLNSLFSLAQSYFLHKMILRSRKKHGSLEARLKKLGIE